MDDVAKKPKTMPRGVRKGGTRFPRYELKDALAWSRKLVSKTHLGPQPEDIIFASVVGSKSSPGQVKVSALRQYGLMDGSTKGYIATNLSKAIAASPADELSPLYTKAALSPDIFKSIFDTFHGDDVSISKLKQRAADLKVHPDEAGRCVEIYISALITAELVTVNGEIVSHRPSSKVIQSSNSPEASLETTEEHSADPTPNETHEQQPNDDVEDLPPQHQAPRAVFNVTVNLDSSLDTEKLEKQLALLKRFGAI